MRKFKEGDVVKVIGNNTDGPHEFEINQLVRISESGPHGLYCPKDSLRDDQYTAETLDKSDWWVVLENEIELS